MDRRSLAGCIALVAAPSLVVAQTAGTQNRDGTYVNFEEAPIHPLELVEAHAELWVANVAAGTISVFKVPGLQLQDEIPVGLGPVAIRQRPGTDEMWVACASSGALFIIDRAARQVIDSFMPGAPVQGVEIPAEPAGLLFSADGALAYCSLSLVNQLVEIDAASRTVVRRFEFGTPFPQPTSPLVHAEEPRALLLDGEMLFALSFESGNGTTADANLQSSTMVDLWDLHLNQGLPPPPDRDLLQFDLTSGTPVGATTLWRMGTLDLDVERLDDGDFVVSNVDANNLLHGEFHFPISGIARHRVSRAAAAVAGAPLPQPTTHIDLNDPAARDPLLPATLRFAIPNDLAPIGGSGRMVVCCYDTANSAVLDLASNTVIAALEAKGFGPRGAAIDGAGKHAWIFNRADATVDEFDLAGLTNGAVLTPAASAPAGFDPTPAVVRAGRLVHIDASNSSSGVQSCNTCHLDGHTDRIAWLLGDFTGSLPDHPVARDDKQVKTTQSLRGIEELPPYHWRGDRADLDAFQPAFEGLLGGTLLSPTEFRNFEAWVFSLTMPANPRQLPSRALSNSGTTGAQRGKLAFETLPILRIAHDTIAPHSDRRLTCSECHSLQGFAGSLNQIVNDVTFPIFPDHPAHLTGLFDKTSDNVDYGTAFPPNLNGLNRLPATGFGLANNGFADALEDFVPDLFNGPPTAEAAITQFLIEFDSGTAIAAMWSFTLTPAKAGTPSTSPIALYLMPQATLRNCDLAVKATLPGLGRVGFRFDPATQLFVADRATIPPQSFAQLDALAQAGGVLTFLGVPVGSGWRIGVDRDADELADGDEIATSSIDPDSDGDSFRDGYELLHGANPADPLSVPSNPIAPVITQATLAFESSVVAKFRWETSGEASGRITLRDPATNVALATFIDRRPVRRHVMVVRGLEPGRSYLAEIDGADANGNFAAVWSIPFVATAHFFESVHSETVVLASTGTNAANQELLQATFTVHGEEGALIDGATVSGRFIEWVGGQAATITPFSSAPTSAGVTTAPHTSLHVDGSGAFVEVVVDSITTSAGEMHFHPHQTDFADRLQL